MMRVLVLLVRYGTEKYRDALDDLEGVYRKQAPELARQTVIVDNAMPADFSEAIGSDRMLIGGDDRDREFSGWQRAIDTLGSKLKSFDAVHLVSAAFQMLYTDYVDRFSARIVEFVARRPVCAGHIDYYPYPIRFGFYVSRHWLRTSFWLINPSELMRLGSVVSIRDKQGLFSGEGNWAFKQGGPLSAGYQQLIHDWLTSEQGTGQGTSWHSRLDLGVEGNRALFEEKAIAIMNEHVLSMRLRAQGTMVVDMTYLARIAESGAPLPNHIPGWREQIKLRGIPGHENIGDPAAR
jgi:hypothetical protein